MKKEEGIADDEDIYIVSQPQVKIHAEEIIDQGAIHKLSDFSPLPQ